MEKTERTNAKAYHCIHLDSQRFLDQFTAIAGAVNGLRNKKFLDVGCGLGQKVYMARKFLEMSATGLELRPAYVKTGNQLLKRYLSYKNETEKEDSFFPRIVRGNAITYKKYQDYDVIYFYRPAPDPVIQEKIEHAIAKGAKAGAIIVGHLVQCFHNPEFLKQYNLTAHNADGKTERYWIKG